MIANITCDKEWRGEQGASLCPLKSKDYFASPEVILAHNWVFCDACRDARILEKTKGQDLIFSNRVPSWIQHEQGMVEENFVEDKLKIKRNKKKYQKKKREIDEELRRMKDKPLPDKKALHVLVKSGLSKSDALSKFVDEKREKAKKIKKSEVETQKKTARDHMPWAPHIHPLLKNKVSVLNRLVDHQRYVAIASNFLNPEPLLRYQHNRKELQMMDNKLLDERREYQKIVSDYVLKKKQTLFSCSDKAVHYVLQRLNKRRDSVIGRYGNAIYTISSENIRNNFRATSVPELVQIFHYGHVPKVNFPNERKRFAFSNNVDEINELFQIRECEEFPLEKDELAITLVMKQDLACVMCASSAVALMHKPFLTDSSNMLIPITVLERFDDGYRKKICVVGKPYPESPINHPTVWRRFLKYSVKAAIYPKFESCNVISSQCAQSEFKNQIATAKCGRFESNGKEEPSSLMTNCQNEGDILSTVSIKNYQNYQNNKQHESENICNDLLSGIMSDMNAATPSLIYGDNSVIYDRNIKELEGVDLQKRYSKFSIGGEFILIRSNNDGVDSTGNSLAITQRAEYAAEFGAERLDEEEWLRDYFKCKFKGASQLIRLRIHSKELHFLQKERYSERNLTINRDDRRRLIEERTYRLEVLLTYLKLLESGSYLLRTTDNGNMHILPKLRHLSDDIGLEMNAGKLQCVSSVPDREKIFHGIDEHFVFVYHIVQKRIPATFQYNKDFRNFKVCGNECAVNQKLQKLGNGASGRNKRKNRQRARRKNRTLYVHKDLDRPE